MRSVTDSTRRSRGADLSAATLAAPAIAALGIIAQAADPDVSAYLEGRGGARTLRHDLVLREEQGGVAGVSGTTWRLDRAGGWSTHRFRVVDGEDRPSARGRRESRLTPGDLGRIAREMGRHRLLELPGRVGPTPARPDVNGHRYTLRFGDHATTLDGVGHRRGGSVRDDIMAGSEELGADDFVLLRRFAELAELIANPHH